MKYSFVPRDTVAYFEKIVNVPSPVGYYVHMNPVMEQLAQELGYTVTYDKKHTSNIYKKLEVANRAELFEKVKDYIAN